ncbi:MAG: hypothetical protein IKR19_08955 [Acholeplasmatales bacterium]|nr:hypothetical protein [Acholeplasmatales bacterium]
MEYLAEVYYPYKDLCNKGKQTIYTKDINKGNIDQYFYSLINIFRDGIETDEVKKMMIHVIFQNDIDVDLSVFDFAMNLMFWQLCTAVDHPIYDIHLVFFDNITKKEIKEYIDNIFIDKYRKALPFRNINNIIDSVLGKFRDLRIFQPYLANTLNLEDTIDLMNQYPEFDETMHFDITGIPIEDIKEAGMKITDKQIEIIKNSNHCLRDSFRTGEAISPKQYKEVAVNIGTKPDGQGSVFSHPIMHSFMNGGLSTPEEVFIESSVGRVAQILQKTNVGESGAFARALELNNQDTYLHDDPTYVCDTCNFQEVTIENETMLKMYDLRYYRENPNGVDKLLQYKTADRDKIMHKKLYFRSPMTCASHSRGHGICYKCYGDLAYAEQDINVGQIASEGLSSIYTQILLSAKHLLESLVIKMEWSEGFAAHMSLAFNTIALRPDVNFHGYKMIIDDEIKTVDDMDDVQYNYYINNFIIRDPSGKEYNIHTSEADNIYIDPDFYEFINKNSKDDSESDEFCVELDMNKMTEMPVLFIIDIKNNELSATMDKIQKLIDNKSVINQYDRHELLRQFTTTNIQGKITLNAVHFEVLLMNQIRSADNIIELPDWSIPNEPYQVLTLSKSLSDNMSITVRLQSSKVSNILRNPDNSKLHKASMSDVYYMEQPQEFLNPEYISDEFKPKSDIEKNVRPAVTFDNPKIRVGNYTGRSKR